MPSDPEHRSIALEALSVRIAEIAEEAHVLAVSANSSVPTRGRGAPRKLARASQDMLILAQAMEVMARRR